MSFSYFNTLNYTMANEDTRLEVAILEKGLSHVTSVCGSGGRVLPLLACAPKAITLVDLSQEQLYLAELRFATLRDLNYEGFCSFWGYPPRSMEPKERKLCFDELKLSLSPNSRSYLEELFKAVDWQSVLYLGRWERTMAKLARVNRLMTGDRGRKLFETLSVAEQEAFLKNEFPRRAWNAVIGLLGNAAVFNSLIYKGHFPKKNIPESFFEFYRRALERCFAQGLVRENFFLQILFFGRLIFSEGLPAEADPEIFSQAKKHVDRARIHYVQGNIIDVLRQSEKTTDFLSISDVPSYFSGDTEREFLQRIRASLSDESTVVLRHYLHIPENCDRTGYRDITVQFEKEIAAEKVQVYSLEILKKGSA